MSDTEVEAVKPDPRCSWQDHSRREFADVGDEIHSAFHSVSTQSAALVFLSSDKLMSCCLVGTVQMGVSI